jgi:hypothetical protein
MDWELLAFAKIEIRGFKFELQLIDDTGGAGTAKRLWIKAQGCFNPGISRSDHYQPGTGCGLNRVAVASSIPSMTQGSRSGNLGL